MTEKLDLTALLGSRICHDLISPIGAIGNGVELLLFDSAARSPELQLITDSVSHANARIRFFRIAFGIASPDQQIGRSEVVGILQDLTRGGRLHIDWQSDSGMPRAEVKLAFLAIQCLETAMPHGGTLNCKLEDRMWQIEAETQRLRFEQDLWALLTDPAASYPVSPAQVHFALLQQELERQGRQVDITPTDEGLQLSF